jgi:hypothetical protein
MRVLHGGTAVLLLLLLLATARHSLPVALTWLRLHHHHPATPHTRCWTLSIVARAAAHTTHTTHAAHAHASRAAAGAAPAATKREALRAGLA